MVRLVVENVEIGRFIGFKGATIRKLREDHKDVQFNVPAKDSGDRSVVVIGRTHADASAAAAAVRQYAPR